MTIAYSNRAQRVLETSHPPAFYIPPEDVAMEYLRISKRATFCEWKGLATYFTIKVDGRTADDAAWTYEDPNSGFLAIKDHIAFYTHLMDECYFDWKKVNYNLNAFSRKWAGVTNTRAQGSLVHSV